MRPSRRIFHTSENFTKSTICGVSTKYRVLTTLENMEFSGNLLILENSGNLKYTQGILVYQKLFFVTGLGAAVYRSQQLVAGGAGNNVFYRLK